MSTSSLYGSVRSPTAAGPATALASRLPVAAIVMQPPRISEMLFGPSLDILTPHVRLENAEIFASVAQIPNPGDIELLITGWGAPPLSDSELASLSSLEALVHAGGNLDYMIPLDSDFRRTVKLSNAGEANAVPVAEYTMSMIVLANKNAFNAAQLYRTRQEFIDREATFPQAGNFGMTVGIIGASRTGRHVLKLLGSYNLNVLVYDPTLTASQIAKLGGVKATLLGLIEGSDVVSIHAPEVPATRGIVGARELAALKTGATIINTSRGPLIDQGALLTELESGRINAILDVTDPDVLAPGHPFYTMDNVMLTPHIAGSMGNELHRLGHHVAEEIARHNLGKSFAFPDLPSRNN